MPRYINAKHLENQVKDALGKINPYLMGQMLRWIRNQPTIDAVEVVRCKDCKYWGDEDGKLQCSDGVLFARCKVHNYLIDGIHTGWCPTENDFCSYGERRGVKA